MDSPLWSGREDSNLRPSEPHSSAPVPEHTISVHVVRVLSAVAALSYHFVLAFTTRFQGILQSAVTYLLPGVLAG
jgi:hypothetical protein